MKVEKPGANVKSTDLPSRVDPTQITPTPDEALSSSTTQAQNPLSPKDTAKLQREASLTTKPGLVTETDTERAQRLVKVHPDDLPCGHLDPVALSSQDLKSTGNIVVIITGPFGGGKDSVANVLHKDASLNTTKAILYTSRPMGNKDVNGVDYYFVSRDEFINMRDNNEFLSWNDLEAGFYGVHLQKTKELLNSGKNVVAAVGPTVAKPLKKGLEIAKIPFVEIFLLPTTRDLLEKADGVNEAIETLRTRLRERGRGKTDETFIDLLLERSRLWLSELHKFQHVVENPHGKLDEATRQIKEIIQAKKLEFLLGLDDAELAKLSPQLRFLETGETPNIHLDTTKFKANKNIAIIVTGPTGVGKNTIFSHVARRGVLNTTESLSNTTRSPRPGEVNGIDYHFLTLDEFMKLAGENKLVEWVMVHNGKFYGKSVVDVQEDLDSGKDIIFALNVSALHYYKHLFNKHGIPFVDIFISPVPKDELSTSSGLDKAIEILRKRTEARKGGETKEQIDDRMRISREWMEQAHLYSYVVESLDGGIDEAVDQFTHIAQKKKNEAYATLGLPSEMLIDIVGDKAAD